MHNQSALMQLINELAVDQYNVQMDNVDPQQFRPIQDVLLCDANRLPIFVLVEKRAGLV